MDRKNVWYGCLFHFCIFSSEFYFNVGRQELKCTHSRINCTDTTEKYNENVRGNSGSRLTVREEKEVICSASKMILRFS